MMTGMLLLAGLVQEFIRSAEANQRRRQTRPSSLTTGGAGYDETGTGLSKNIDGI